MRSRSLFPLLFATLAACSSPSTTEDVGADDVALSTGLSGCPGTDWASPDSWRGLAGSYVRTTSFPAPPDEIASLSVLADPGVENTTGFARTLGTGWTETGILRPLPDNPAIGPVFAFEDASGAARDVYWASWLVRSRFTGRVLRVCLQKTWSADHDVDAREAFTVSRVGY